MKKALPTFTLALALLAACGGGGSTSSVSIDTVTPGRASLRGYAGLPAPNLHWSLSFVGDLSTLDGQTVYIGVVVAGGPAYGDPSFWVSGANTLEIVLTATAPEPAPARYAGTAEIYLCLDENCTRQLGRSPWQTSFTIDVAPGIRFSQPSLAIEAPFGVMPPPGRVDVLLPTGAMDPRLTATADPALRVVGDGTTGLVATGALAPAGTYASTATVEVGVPDPNGGYDPVKLRASLPVSYTVLPDPARPFLLSPASYAFTLSPNAYTTVSEWRGPTVLQQVAGGRHELVETRYLAAPAGASASALAASWVRLSNGLPPAVSTQACAGYAPTPDCLPPGDYRAAVRVRYHPASGDPSELDLPVALTVEPTCGGAAPDLQADLANCGACYRRCNPGFACTAGACECGGGKSICGGGISCHDLTSEKYNCGACGVGCGGSLSCVGGACCPGGLTDCGGACVDVKTSHEHCGRCGNGCAGAYGCFDGACGCGPGKMLCGYGCIDVTADVRNCGGCGVVCNAEQACQGGQCTCPAGLTGCGGRYGSCVFLATDQANCGACGVACGVGEVCSNGSCGCQPGSARCGGGGCVDLASDAWHCGVCDAACPAGQTCTAGGCADDVSASRTVGVDAAHAGVNAGETAVPPATLAWSAIGSGCDGGPPVVEGGRALLFSWRAMHGHSVTTGAESWRREMPDAAATSCATLRDGVAYLPWIEWTGTTRVGHLDAIDLGDGRVLDSAVTGPALPNLFLYLSPLVVGDAVFTGGGDAGGLLGYGLPPALTGRFALDFASMDHWAPGWAAGAVHTSLDGTLRAHDPLTGAVLASRALVTPGMPFTQSGTPVFGSALGYVVTITQYGSRLDAFTPGTLEPAWSATGRFRHWPAVAGDELYVINDPTGYSGQLQARDALTGAVRWTFDGDGQLFYPPVVAAGHLYVSSGYNVYAIDLATHQQVWTAPTGGYLTVAEGMLLTSANARITAYRLTR